MYVDSNFTTGLFTSRYYSSFVASNNCAHYNVKCLSLTQLGFAQYFLAEKEKNLSSSICRQCAHILTSALAKFTSYNQNYSECDIPDSFPKLH